MNLEEKIAQFRAFISQRDNIDRQIAEILGDAAPAPLTQQRRWHTANKKGKKLQKEIEGHYATAPRKGRVGEADKADVEKALIDGMSVVACFEKYGPKLGVSSAWFYLLRTRLRSEGKL